MKPIYVDVVEDTCGLCPRWTSLGLHGFHSKFVLQPSGNRNLGRYKQKTRAFWVIVGWIIYIYICSATVIEEFISQLSSGYLIYVKITIFDGRIGKWENNLFSVMLNYRMVNLTLFHGVFVICRCGSLRKKRSRRMKRRKMTTAASGKVVNRGVWKQTRRGRMGWWDDDGWWVSHNLLSHMLKAFYDTYF